MSSKHGLLSTMARTVAEDGLGGNVEGVRRSGAGRWIARVAGVALGVAVVALSARWTLPVPGSSVPQSAQTLAVALLGAFGARAAAATLAAYVLVGALGLPVFSDGGSGWSHLLGPTGGYIVGFLVAGTLVGALADARKLAKWTVALGALVLAHLVILTLGWAWLATSIGAREAFRTGVAPFLVGGLVKSALGAPLAAAWVHRVLRLRRIAIPGGACPSPVTDLAATGPAVHSCAASTEACGPRSSSW